MWHGFLTSLSHGYTSLDFYMLVVRISRGPRIYLSLACTDSQLLGFVGEYWSDKSLSSLPLGFLLECGYRLALTFEPANLSRPRDRPVGIDILYIGLPFELLINWETFQSHFCYHILGVGSEGGLPHPTPVWRGGLPCPATLGRGFSRPYFGSWAGVIWGGPCLVCELPFRRKYSRL